MVFSLFPLLVELKFSGVVSVNSSLVLLNISIVFVVISLGLIVLIPFTERLVRIRTFLMSFLSASLVLLGALIVFFGA